MHAPPPPPGPPPGMPPGIVRTTTPNPPPPPHPPGSAPPPPGSAPPPPPPKPPAHIMTTTASTAAATPAAKKRANAASTSNTKPTPSSGTTQQSAAKKLKAATSPPASAGGAGTYSSGIKTKPAIKPIETEETLFQRSLRNLGQSNLGDLLHLVEGLVEHRKRGESSATTRDFLQKYMHEQTAWSGDYCASLLVPIYATQNSNTDTLDDVSMLNLSLRNTSSRDLIERFLKPNWWLPPGSTTTTTSAAAVAQPPPPPVASTETCAFALWATNQFASTAASAGNMDTSDALLAKWAVLPQGTKTHFENLATQENKMREVYMKKRQ